MSLKKDVFKTWIEDQVVFNTITIASMAAGLSKKNISKLKRKIVRQIAEIRSLTGFFDVSELNDFLMNYELPKEKSLKQNFIKLYDLLDGDVITFIEYLREKGIANEELSKIEKKQSVNTVIKKHDTWFDLLLDQDDDEEKEEMLFTIANRFFEFCFSPKTFPLFKKMLKTKTDYSILRLIYSVTWSNLAEIGWQHWHGDCLADLRKKADAGKEIVYVAGGTDIYQLIKYGIYNIRVIDPLLPTQPKYYSQGWDWFIEGEIGDSAKIPCDHRTLMIKRVAHTDLGRSFTITLSNKKEETFAETETVWHVCDEKGAVLGEVTFERRLTNQDDFALKSNQVMLLSFNELYFVSAPEDRDGWGINSRKFSDDMQIYIKQLEKPVTKEMVNNFRYEIDQEDFVFIELGSCVD